MSYPKDITLEEIGELALKMQEKINYYSELVEASQGEGWDNDPTGSLHISEYSRKVNTAANLFTEAAKLYWFQEGKFESDDEATQFLTKQGYKESNGLIIGLNRAETKAESAAINYLCSEWDYGYSSVDLWKTEGKSNE